MGLFDLFKKKPDPHPTSSVSPAPTPPAPAAKQKMTATEVADRLEAMGYFNYIAPVHVEKVKSEISTGLAEKGYFYGVELEVKPWTKLDPRHFNIDNEWLYEEGGIKDAVQEVKSFLEFMHIQLEASDHIEAYDAENEWVNQSLIINGQQYIIFDKFKEGYGWGEAAQRFADMINHQLELHHSKERLYLIHGGNDGRAVLLTPEMREFVAAFITNKNEAPLEIDEWCKLNEVTRVSVLPV